MDIHSETRVRTGAQFDATQTRFLDRREEPKLGWKAT